PRGRVRRGGQAADHARHLRPVQRLLRRLLRQGAAGADADHQGLRSGVRTGGRAHLAADAHHRVRHRRARRRPAGDVPGGPVHDPVQPGGERGDLRADRARARERPAGWPPGDGAAAGRRPGVPGGRGGRGGVHRAVGAPAARRGEGTVVTVSYEAALQKYEPVFGLETHVELGTTTKMFCGCITTFGADPNTHTCPICLGLPGSVPVVNERAIEYAIKIGLALNCSIASWCRFARKNYFYPDMPKNFQISQYDEPLCTDGYLDVRLDGDGHGGPGAGGRQAEGGSTRTVRVGIERVHLEEDTGKSLHVGGATGRIHGAEYSLVDYNRAGIPLVEIVTRPVTGTGEDAPVAARLYVTELRDLLRSLGVSDVRMEEGSLRCDVNTSLAPPGAPWGTRTETKNVNSLRSVERAVEFEIERQAAVLDAGGRVIQETRHLHEDTATTTSGRSKEEAQDYRYFPEPDLVPVAPPRDWVEQIRASLPEAPAKVRARLRAEWNVSA